MSPLPRCCNLFCFRSDENENCLFSAFSIVMSGDNRYVDDLRILACIELYLNSAFYGKHPSSVKVMNSYCGVFNNVNTLLAPSVSHGALDSGKTKNGASERRNTQYLQAI